MRRLSFPKLHFLTSITILFAFFTSFAFAQKSNINGIITDAKGQAIAFAFVIDPKFGNATFTDKDGMFSLSTEIPCTIIAKASAFKTISSRIESPKNINITMQGDENSNHTNTYSTDFFKENITVEGLAQNRGSQYIATEKGLHGSRYLFDKWVHGYFVTSDDSIKQENNYRFNYAKIDGTLLYSEDGKSVKQFDGRQIKMFMLFTDDSKFYNFESVPAINTNHFTQVLASGSKYKIYKQVLTKFKAADYVSNGMTSTGTTYDEFLDETTYYIIKAGNVPQKFYLKKKSLKEVFAVDADKLNKFMSAHNGDDINDQFLQQLGDDFNK